MFSYLKTFSTGQPFTVITDISILNKIIKPVFTNQFHSLFLIYFSHVLKINQDTVQYKDCIIELSRHTNDTSCFDILADKFTYCYIEKKSPCVGTNKIFKHA